jgi:hypothetical protein
MSSNLHQSLFEPSLYANPSVLLRIIVEPASHHLAERHLRDLIDMRIGVPNILQIAILEIANFLFQKIAVIKIRETVPSYEGQLRDRFGHAVKG